jgi:predicted regulator of Ras-like GTPase activity (Roadblock/LC7/MglB family)
MIVDRLLGILEDIDGVRGSFVVAAGGQLASYSMPDEFDLFDLQLSAARIARILQCGSANGLRTEDGIFDFGDGKLLVREFVRGYLCVLCSPDVNMRSLRLTARLVARSMPQEIAAPTGA